VEAKKAEDGKDNAEKPAAQLPPRQPTFLARYKRSVKISCAGGFLVAAILLLGLIPGLWRNAEPKPLTVAHAADTRNAPRSMTVAPMAAAGSGTSSVQNQQDDRSVKMDQAPDPALSEDSPAGSLPRIAEDGRQPWQAYARPFDTGDNRPRIAIVIADLGLSREATEDAISKLPANVTLAFDTQSPVAGAWFNRARQGGHETLLEIPMEPFDYPRSDPGPDTLLTTLQGADNLARLLKDLRLGAGYIGVTTLSGSRFTTDPGNMTPVLDTLRKRGLMILDAHIGPHSTVMDLAHDMKVPAAVVTERIDRDLTPDAIDTTLQQLEQTARLTGHAIGIASPTPVVLDRLQVWLKDLPRRGIALAPVSAMVM
jgi:polysaccharide deacetylase 2 family uncharacterized protein YibQ